MDNSKEKAVIDFLLMCDEIKKNPLFFNFAHAQDGNQQLVTASNDTSIHRPYIDGSVFKRYTFTIIDFRSITYDPLTNRIGYENENVEEFLNVQNIIQWIQEQELNKNYPDFGENCTIQEMRALNDTPALNGVDSNVSPALAKYSISIQLDYVDTSNILWR